MSRRGAGGRGKGKAGGSAKDDLAKAALEALNNINTISTQVVESAKKAVSAGRARLTQQQAGNDAGDSADKPPLHQQLEQQLEQQQQQQQQQAHEAAAQSPHGALATSMHLATAMADCNFVPSPNRSPPKVADTGGRMRPDSSFMFPISAPTFSPATIARNRSSADPAAVGSAAPGAQPTSQQQQEPTPVPQLHEQLFDAVATHDAAATEPLLLTTPSAAPPAARSAFGYLIRGTIRRALTPPPRPNATAAGAALLLLVLVLSAAAFSRARSNTAVQRLLAADVAALQQDLAAARGEVAAAAAEAEAGSQQAAEALAAVAADLQSQLSTLQRQVTQHMSQAQGILEATRAELRSLGDELRAVRHAQERRPAVPSIVVGGGGGGAAAAINTSAATVAPHAGSDAGEPEAAELRGLPACHVRRMVAAAGPLLDVRVTGHSPVVGDQQLLMRFHAATSRMFSPSSDPRVHPLARFVTDPSVPPVCLPLASASAPTVAAATAAGGATGCGVGGGGCPVQGFIDLRLPTPANVSALSFRYTAYGTWDTYSALLHISVTLYEAPAAAAASAAATGSGSAASPGGGEAAVTGLDGLQVRRVELPPLKGSECQLVRLTAGAAGGSAGPGPGPREAGGGGGGGARMLVHRITVHVHRKFGPSEYTCIPRVLVHGWEA